MADPKGNLVTPVGFRADGSIHALELDDSDRLKVILDAITGNITVDGLSPSIFRPVASHVRLDNIALPAGASIQSILTVPANQIYRLTGLSLIYVGTVAGVTMTARITDGANVYPFYKVGTVVSGELYASTFSNILASGQSITVAIAAATLNDDFVGTVFCERIA